MSRMREEQTAGYYYRRLEPGGDAFESTGITCSNWDDAIQHGSPPLALLTKAIEEHLVDSPLRIGRLSLDILGAIPVAPVKVRAWVKRPGRRICVLEAEMTPVGDDAARPVARVTAWALATTTPATSPLTVIPRWSRGQRGRCRTSGGDCPGISPAWTGGRRSTIPTGPRCSG